MLSIPFKSSQPRPASFPLVVSAVMPSESPNRSKHPPPIGTARLVVSGTSLAVVADQLEPANHLADGEETKAFGCHHTTGDDLCRRDVPEVGKGGPGRGGRLLDALEEGARVLDLLQQVVPVALDGGHGPGGKGLSVNKAWCTFSRRRGASLRVGRRLGPGETHGGVMCWPLKTSLDSSTPTLE